jgi:hypothetical protein
MEISSYGFNPKEGLFPRSLLRGVSLVKDGNVVYGDVKVLSNTGARYWSNDFLEVKEANSGRQSTEEV